MQSPYPPRPPCPPLPAPTGESDRDLVARLSGPEDGHHHAVALLLARHWRAARDYAVVCLAAAGPTAQLVATAAFHRVLGRTAAGAAGGALRPRLLVAVRDLVRAWAVDDAARIALPELRRTTGGRGLRATKPGPPESRQLAARAFRALPGASQCLLWHTEVEAEPINIPAGLLGIDTATAATVLEQAREQFRAGCVRAHRELAPTAECRFYNRLLDVPLRRGGALLPDVRRHLTVCAHCRHAAEQLGLFDGGLPLLLAEAVLGWGARRYLAARPGRAAPEEWPAPPPSAPPAASPGAGGRHRTEAEPRHRAAVALGVGLVSLALLTTALVAGSRSGDNAVPAPGAAWGAPAGATREASAGGAREAPAGGTGGAHAGGAARPSGAGARPAASPSTASVGVPAEVAHGTLRGLASGLCLDVRGDRVAVGAGVRLAACSTALAQQWSYQDDGLLRSAADPALCLAADPRTRAVALAGCRAPAAEVSYDVTVGGEILLRRDHGLALAPGSGRSGARVGVAERDGSAGQRWALQPAAVGGRPRSGTVPDGRAEPDRGAEPARGAKPGRRVVPDGRGVPDARGGRAGAGAGRSPDRQEGTGGSRGKPGRTGLGVGGRGTAPRVAQIRAARTDRPAGGVRAVGEAGDLPAPVPDTFGGPGAPGTLDLPDTLTSPIAGRSAGGGSPATAAVRGVLG
ncbi:RICIN domain-containing protein [Streptomyces cinerochromogenes]|uniref:RICIN domain-containing protein n=1 Tax=Streptomyces cinerochromogenes TaxID=66422 RepID=UPI001670477C|nr:RICIN domain-containing protein [Streptomyces cinerochromogenes]GGS75944.1 hydrolase [Streptomyces cinerochromogenes]